MVLNLFNYPKMLKFAVFSSLFFKLYNFSRIFFHSSCTTSINKIYIKISTFHNSFNLLHFSLNYWHLKILKPNSIKHNTHKNLSLSLSFFPLFVKHQYHSKIDDQIDKALASMTQGLINKLVSVLEGVLGKLARYDEGSLIGSLLSFTVRWFKNYFEKKYLNFCLLECLWIR